jgi:hypothetical protein
MAFLNPMDLESGNDDDLSTVVGTEILAASDPISE